MEINIENIIFVLKILVWGTLGTLIIVIFTWHYTILKNMFYFGNSHFAIITKIEKIIFVIVSMIILLLFLFLFGSSLNTIFEIIKGWVNKTT